MEKKNEVMELSFRFAIDVIAFCDILEENKKYVIANQLLKSGTAIGANICEAQNAESSYDFIHKLKIAAKEAEESEYWLELIRATATNIPPPEFLFNQITSIKKLLNKIVSTMKRQAQPKFR